jgi:hypothetical protein
MVMQNNYQNIRANSEGGERLSYEMQMLQRQVSELKQVQQTQAEIMKVRQK